MASLEEFFPFESIRTVTTSEQGDFARIQFCTGLSLGIGWVDIGRLVH